MKKEKIQTQMGMELRPLFSVLSSYDDFPVYVYRVSIKYQEHL